MPIQDIYLGTSELEFCSRFLQESDGIICKCQSNEDTHKHNVLNHNLEGNTVLIWGETLNRQIVTSVPTSA